MTGHRYLNILPLLVLAGACEPGPAEPDPADLSSPQPDVPDGSGAQSAAPARHHALQRIAEVTLTATEGNHAGGSVRFLPEDGAVRIAGKITGLTPGAHGLHIHARGDCSAPDASSAGPHLSPQDDPHGSPQDLPHQHHVGDLGNVEAGADGTADVSIGIPALALSGPASIIGKALVVHAVRDDLETQPSGDSGTRVGCGVIREAAGTADATKTDGAGTTLARGTAR